MVGRRRTFLTEDFNRTGDQRSVLVRIERRELDGKAIRRRDVVGVMTGNNDSSRLQQRPIRAWISTLILLVAEQMHSGVLTLVRIENPSCIVGGGIIHDQELEIGDGLREDTLNGFPYERFSISHGHDDAEPH